MKTRIILVISVVIALVVAGLSVASASPSSMSAVSEEGTILNYALQEKLTQEINVPSVAAPSWSVYEEKMANGRTWYAYAKGKIRMFKSVKVDQEIYCLTNAKGEVFSAKITQIFNPPPVVEAKKPSRVWVQFERVSPTTNKPWLPASGPAVIFKNWGLF